MQPRLYEGRQMIMAQRRFPGRRAFTRRRLFWRVRRRREWIFQPGQGCCLQVRSLKEIVQDVGSVARLLRQGGDLCADLAQPNSRSH